MISLPRVTNIITDKNNIATGLFHTTDVTLANLLRRAILSEIETYAIDVVIFQINNSARHDEIIALRLGQLVINNELFDKTLENTRIPIDVSGPTEFTTENIDLPFKYVTPICELRKGQRIKCDVIVKSGKGKTNCKWRPVSNVSMIEVRNEYFISTIDISKEFKVSDNEIFYIDSVIFHVNTSFMSNEYLATNIARLQIDYNNFIDPGMDTLVSHIDFLGPGDFLVGNLPGVDINFKYHASIGFVSEYQQIKCDVIIKRGRRTEYIKWKSINDNFTNAQAGYFFKFKNIGMLSTEQIFKLGIANIIEAANREANTLFSHVLVPANMKPFIS